MISRNSTKVNLHQRVLDALTLYFLEDRLVANCSNCLLSTKCILDAEILSLEREYNVDNKTCFCEALCRNDLVELQRHRGDLQKV